jgi:hypothetical protein
LKNIIFQQGVRQSALPHCGNMHYSRQRYVDPALRRFPSSPDQSHAPGTP